MRAAAGAPSPLGARPRILVTDADPLRRQGVAEVFRARGFDVDTAADAEETLQRLRRSAPALLVAHLDTPGLDGPALVRAARRDRPDTRVVLVAGRAGVTAAVAALRAGAHDVVEEPMAAAQLAALADEVEPLEADNGVVAASAAMREVLAQALRVARSEATVLILGESGSGKEMVAQAIHRWSARAQGPFVAVNCAAMPETLVEAELFGHERGAFTDARLGRAGVIEQADGGTLFLDEIGEMPLAAQAKLLRVIQDRLVRRIGGSETRLVDVRFVAASNRCLRTAVRERGFREDLYFRLEVMSLTLPPLRERPEDIDALARRFAAGWASTYGRGALGLTPEALAVLRAHPWPGNVRELENTVHRAVIDTDGPRIEARDISLDRAAVTAPAGPAPAVRPWPEVEKELILATLAHVGGNRKRAAELIGIGERTLRNRLRAYRVEAQLA